MEFGEMALKKHFAPDVLIVERVSPSVLKSWLSSQC
jgi:hypothetical protein